MKYRGFEIKKEQSHYVVISLFPSSIGMEEWREDTIEDAKREVDEFWDGLIHVDWGKEET